MRSLSSRAGVAAAVLGLSAILGGQDAGFEPRSGYGTDDLQVLTLSHVAFVPTNAAQTYLSFCCVADSYRRPTANPGSATFFDVPVNHPFFQFVEALSASGITAGCGTGIYCPESPLTRGQMAVFLAKALGLHWPATVP